MREQCRVSQPPSYTTTIVTVREGAAAAVTSDARGHVTTRAVTMTVDTRRMSEADRAGLAARSPEGHAAKSMHIRGREEEWIQIQANTFKNWVNVNLKECGLEVGDLATDFTDGTRSVETPRIVMMMMIWK